MNHVSKFGEGGWNISTAAIIKILVAIAAVGVFLKIYPLLMMFFIGAMIAVSLEPLAQRLQSKGLSRSRAISAISLVIIGLMLIVGLIVIPSIYNQVALLVQAAPDLRAKFLSYFPAGSQFREAASSLLESYQTVGASTLVGHAISVVSFIGEGASEIGVVLIFAIYLLSDGKRAWKWCSDFFSAPVRIKLRTTGRESSRVIQNYIAGQVITSVLCGIFSYVVLICLGVPGALTLAVIALVFDVVPILGFFIALVPAMMIAALVSPVASIAVLILYTLYNAFENYYLVPKIYGKSMQISPLVVLLSLILATLLGGILGAMAILPIVAAYPSIERIWLVKYLGRGVIQRHRSTDEESFHSEQLELWSRSTTSLDRMPGTLPGIQLMRTLGKKILLVDDDEDIRDMLQDILETEGYSSVLAGNGREALAILKTQNDIGLILLDLVMPVMNGREFLKELRATPSLQRLPVVLLSADADDLDFDASESVIKKPCDMAVVLDTVEELYGSSHSA